MVQPTAAPSPALVGSPERTGNLPPSTRPSRSSRRALWLLCLLPAVACASTADGEHACPPRDDRFGVKTDYAIPPIRGSIRWRQPPDLATFLEIKDDADYLTCFEDDHTSVVEVRIGDVPKAHRLSENEVVVTSGNPDICIPPTQQAPADRVAADRVVAIPNGTPVAWKLEYDMPYLTFSMLNRDYRVKLTEPIAEIMLRARAAKSGTSMHVNPTVLRTFFKKCDSGNLDDNSLVAHSRVQGDPDWLRISLEHLAHKFILEGFSTFTWKESDPPLRSQLAFQIKLNCNTPPIVAPPRSALAHGPWSTEYEIRDGGMVFWNMAGGARQMARSVNIASARNLSGATGGTHSFKLNVPDAYWHRNHLVRFNVMTVEKPADTPGTFKFARATFHLHSDHECMRVTQWYELHDTLNPWREINGFPYVRIPTDQFSNPIPFANFENTLYPADMFFPISYYEVLRNCSQPRFAFALELDTRIEWRGTDAKRGQAFARDPDSFDELGDRFLDFAEFGVQWKNSNPAGREILWTPIASNAREIGNDQPDNLHWNPLDYYIDGPAGVRGFLSHGSMTPGGCPECAHIHWRWGTFLGYNQGNPLIPVNEKGCGVVALQSVFVAAVVARSSELFYDNLSDVVNDEALVGLDESGDIVSAAPHAFIYNGRSPSSSNAFFAHPLWFNSNYSESNEENNYPSFRTAGNN